MTTPYGVWVSVIRDGRVVRLDPVSHRVDLRVSLRPAGSEPEGLAYDGHSLWVVDQAHDRVSRGPAHRLGRPVGAGRWVAAAGGRGTSAVWVSNYEDGVADPGREWPAAGPARAPFVRTVDLRLPWPQGVAGAAAWCGWRARRAAPWWASTCAACGAWSCCAGRTPPTR